MGMWMRKCIGVIWISQALSQLRVPANTTEYIVAARFTSVLLPGSEIATYEAGTLIQWSIILPEGRTSIVIHRLRTEYIRLREFYSDRIIYHVDTTGLELKSADLGDRAIYENSVTTFGSSGKRMYYDKILDVQEILKPPTIVQNPNPAADLVQLHCVEKNGEAQTISWSKGSELLGNNATYKLSLDNRTLTVKTEYLQMCQQYTCVIRNKVSENWNTHLLVQEGLLMFHESSLISTTIAVVSASLSYGAAVFILLFALGKYRVYKRHLQLTTVFVFCQMITLLCLLVSSLLCTLNPASPLAYRIVEALGFVFTLAIIFYNLFFYLHPESQLRRSFLAKQRHRNFFLVYGLIEIMISAVPIYRGQQDIHLCQLSTSSIPGTIAIAVVIIIFMLGLAFTMLVKFMMTWTKFRRLSHLSSR